MAQLADDHMKTVGAQIDGRDDRAVVGFGNRVVQTVNDCPQPQVVCAFGFRMMNCAPDKSS